MVCGALVRRKLALYARHALPHCTTAPAIFFFGDTEGCATVAVAAARPGARCVTTWHEERHVFAAADDVKDCAGPDALEVFDQSACAPAESFGRVDAFGAEVIELLVVSVENDFFFVSIFERFRALDVGVVCNGAG